MTETSTRPSTSARRSHQPRRRRTLSGITPSGSLTLGNYLGALGRFASGQDDVEGFYFVADLHALTTEHEPATTRRLVDETAALFYAVGLDPERSTVFIQSQVPAHVELAYLLESTAYVGELGRMIQFKDKGGRPKTRASLFTYPCLMAADILLYDTESVPVGGDQDQHVELSRDLAVRFNRSYGETFVIPELARSAVAARVTDLSDPTVKMSKSAAPDAAGVVRMRDTPDVIRRKVARAVTDSESVVRYAPAEKPGVSNLLDILASLEDSTPDALAADYTSYGALKAACSERIIETLRPVQRRYDELDTDPQMLQALLDRGAERARAVSGPVLARARNAIGLT